MTTWHERLGSVGGAVAAFFALRIAAMLACHAASGGGEFSDDVPTMLAAARFPWAALLAHYHLVAEGVGNHPPLFGFAVVVIAPLAKLIGPFFAVRSVLVLFEAAALALVLCAIPERRRSTAWCLALFPAGWVSTAVFGQEEYLAGLLILWAALDVQRRSRHVAGAIPLAAPLLFAKFFSVALLVPLAPQAWRHRRRALLTATGLVAAVMAAWFAIHAWAGAPLPLLRTIDEGYIAQPALGFLYDGLGLDASTLRLATAVLVALLIGGGTLLRWNTLASNSRVGLSAAALAGVLFVLLFYHSYPEYLALATPLIALLAATTTRRPHRLALWSALFTAGTAGWAFNVFRGLHRASEAGSGVKWQLRTLYESIAPAATLEPAAWCSNALYVVGLVLLLATLWMMTREVAGKPSA